MNTVLSVDRDSGEVSIEEMNKLIDLDRYPIDRLNSKAGQLLVARCRSDLDDCAAATLPSFIRQAEIANLVEEAESLVQVAHRYDGDSVTFYEEDDIGCSDTDSLESVVRSARHPNRYCQILNYQIPNHSDLRAIYLWPPLTEFIRQVLNVEQLFLSQCPHLALTMKVAYEGDTDGWHYDPNDGVITLVLQTADNGGEFEYAPNIRNKIDQNYAGVDRLFKSPDIEATRLALEPGTFTFFNGRHSMHRVRPVGSTRQPRIVSIFSFDQRPDHFFAQSYIDKLRRFPQGPPIVV
ncbi:MAG: hypothetical protein KYX61_05375 [Gammaproteobacteria bacterium]|jgi:hypothetical protein|nr:hypothetical protein [Gammaproteobacteria bacterium]|tara:strand:- start:51 stop:929 length:879 start_codon:yes stop_codon:yes gene_type:complete